MGTTNGQLYAMMYGGKNTDILSLYFSTLSASSVSSRQAARDLERQIEYLSKAQANYQKELKRLRLEGGDKAEARKTLRQLRGERERLLKAQGQNERALESAKQKGFSQRVTVAELRADAADDVEKKYTLPSGAKRELGDIANDAAYQMSQGNAAANMAALIRSKGTHKGLPPEQLKVYIAQLAADLENVRQTKTPPPLTKRALQGIILQNTNYEGRIFSPAEIEIAKAQDIEEAQAIYAGLNPDTTLAEAGTAQEEIRKEAALLKPQIERAQEAVGETQLPRATELQESADLQGYLADVADDFELNQSAGAYDAAKANIERQELRQIAEREPGVVTIETQELLAPEFVQREYELQQARARRQAGTGADPMEFLLQTPQLDMLSSGRELRQFIADLKSGTKKEELKAQLVAQNNPDSAYGQAWQQASPEMRVLMSLIPQAASKSKADLSPSTMLEKKAAQAIQTAGGAANLDGTNIMRLAQELTQDQAEQREFATYILASQRIDQVVPADITSSLAEAMEEEPAKEEAYITPRDMQREAALDALLSEPGGEAPTATSGGFPLF